MTEDCALARASVSALDPVLGLRAATAGHPTTNGHPLNRWAPMAPAGPSPVPFRLRSHVCYNRRRSEALRGDGACLLQAQCFPASGELQALRCRTPTWRVDLPDLPAASRYPH